MNLQKIMLGENLTQTERVYLESLTHHDGYPVLEKIMTEACRIATEDIVKLDPEEKDYTEKVAARAARSRSINEFCGAVFKSIRGNIAVAENNERKANDRNADAN